MASGTTVGEPRVEMVCGCGARGLVPAKFAGARIRCRSCGQHAVVGPAPKAPPSSGDLAWAPRRTPPQQPALAPVAPARAVAAVAPSAPPALDLLPEPEPAPSLVPLPGPAPAVEGRGRPRSRAGRARARHGDGLEAAEAAASRDVDQERHVRAIAFWWRLSAVLGLVALVGALLVSALGGIPLRLVLPMLIVPALTTGVSWVLGQALWRYHDAGRWVAIALNGLGVVLGVGGILSVLSQGAVLLAGAGLIQVAWPAAIVQCLLSPRSAALCTAEYREAVERSPGVSVPWWTSPFFLVPVALCGLALLALLAALGGGLLLARR